MQLDLEVQDVIRAGSRGTAIVFPLHRENPVWRGAAEQIHQFTFVAGFKVAVHGGNDVVCASCGADGKVAGGHFSSKGQKAVGLNADLCVVFIVEGEGESQVNGIEAFIVIGVITQDGASGDFGVGADGAGEIIFIHLGKNGKSHYRKNQQEHELVKACFHNISLRIFFCF